jgi:hypothetical protein
MMRCVCRFLVILVALILTTAHALPVLLNDQVETAQHLQRAAYIASHLAAVRTSASLLKLGLNFSSNSSTTSTDPMTSTDNREFVHTMFGISPPTSPHTSRDSKLQCQDENVDTTTAIGSGIHSGATAVSTDQGLIGTLHSSSSGYNTGAMTHDVTVNTVTAGDSTAGKHHRRYFGNNCSIIVIAVNRHESASHASAVHA